MILEIAFIKVAPKNHAEFEKSVRKAVSEILSTAKGFIDFEMHRGIEQENTYALHIHWQTLEDHTIGFRQSELFTRWRGQIGVYFEEAPVVEHWKSVD